MASQPLSERLRDTEHIRGLFTLTNLALLALVLVVVVMTKYVFSTPYLIKDIMTRGGEKELRTHERTARAARRLMARQRRRERRSAAYGKKAASRPSAAAVADVSAAEAKPIPRKTAVSFKSLMRGDAPQPDLTSSPSTAAAATRPDAAAATTAAAAAAAATTTTATAAAAASAPPASAEAEEETVPLATTETADVEAGTHDAAASSAAAAAARPAPSSSGSQKLRLAAKRSAEDGAKDAVDVLQGFVRVSERQLFVSLDLQMFVRDNVAVALSFVGFAIACFVVMSGPRTFAPPTSDDSFDSFADIVLWTFIGFGLLLIAGATNDYLILYRVRNRPELLRGNRAVGLVEAGTYIASSFIIRACTVDGGIDVPFSEEIGTAVIYFVLGQLMLVVATAVLEFITPYNGQGEVRAGNVAAGITMASQQIAIAQIVSSPLLKSESLVTFGIYAGLGLLVLTLLRGFSAKLLLPMRPGRSIHEEVSQDRNWGVALVEAAFINAVAANLDSLLNAPGCPKPAAVK